MGFAVRGTDRTIVAPNWLLELLNPFVQQLLTTILRTVVTVWQTGQADGESVAANISLECLTGSGQVICDGLFSAIGLSSLCRTKRCQSSRHPKDLFDRRSDPILSATGVPSESERNSTLAMGCGDPGQASLACKLMFADVDSALEIASSCGPTGSPLPLTHPSQTFDPHPSDNCGCNDEHDVH